MGCFKKEREREEGAVTVSQSEVKGDFIEELGF